MLSLLLQGLLTMNFQHKAAPGCIRCPPCSMQSVKEGEAHVLHNVSNPEEWQALPAES